MARNGLVFPRAKIDLSDVRDAIEREKQLKGFRREKKVALIEAQNPQWEDLAADWFR